MPTPGDLLLDRYRILERLGSGGTATVHRGRDERLERDVAVKILLPNLAGDPATAARFEREARSLAASAHPGVVAVFDVDAGDPTTGREPFFVMELCRGGSLADRLAGGRGIAPDDLVPVLVPIADGLADLHRRGVVHRDIKPQNILFADDRAKLADFGLALSNDGDGVGELTTPGTAVGTLAFLAPEVLAGERATPAADVYGLGVVAFVGLTGRPPRPASSMAELIGASQTTPPPVSTVAPDLGPAFDDIVGAALAARPDERPDALAFGSGLATALGRWTRDGGPARRSATGFPSGPIHDESALVAVARSPAWDAASADDVTTAMATSAGAIPAGATAAVPIPDAAAGRPPAADGPIGQRKGGFVPGRRVAAAIAVVFVVVALAAAIAAISPPSPPSGGSGSPSPLPSRTTASGTPSRAPSPSAPARTADPALAALDAVDAAIAAARGGPDGLKGKEANDLEKRAADVRRALDAGDRRGALAAARELDKRIRDVDKGADALRQASADLIQALGG